VARDNIEVKNEWDVVFCDDKWFPRELPKIF
jgi:hypothetical protein